MLESVFQKSKNTEGIFEKQRDALIEFARFELPGLRYKSGRTSYNVRKYVFEADQARLVPLYTTKKWYRDIIETELGLPPGQSCSIVREPEPRRLAIIVPRQDKQFLYLGDGIEYMHSLPKKQNEMIAYAGERVDGEPAILNFNDIPHWLFGGATGSGKTILIYDVLMSMLDRYTPDELWIYLADHKNTITHFEGVPHVKLQASDIEDIRDLFRNVSKMMEDRTAILNGMKWEYYNRKFPASALPRVLVVFDEIDNVIGKDRKTPISSEIREYIRTIAAEARSLGIHLVVASQKPVAANLDTRITSNITGRIALKVQNSMNSRQIIDRKGAETLMGNGDAFYHVTAGDDIRMQCAYAVEEEIEDAKEVLRKAYQNT